MTGRCVDVFAPGVRVLGASHENVNNFVEWTGTSMAAPIVAGAILAENGRAGFFSKQEIVSAATNGVLWDEVRPWGFPKCKHCFISELVTVVHTSRYIRLTLFFYNHSSFRISKRRTTRRALLGTRSGERSGFETRDRGACFPGLPTRCCLFQGNATAVGRERRDSTFSKRH
jgi:hypothetical protein